MISKQAQKYLKLSWGAAAQALNLSPPYALLHGGLGDQQSDRPQILHSLRRIAQQVQLKLNDSAVQIALAGVKELENDPVFNAGFGAKLQRDGVGRLSAALMDGSRQRMSAVSNVLGIEHPSELAALLLESKDRVLSGVEASRFAFTHGFKPEILTTEARLQEWEEKKEKLFGTVGCIALDQNSKTAACTSTGGRGFETPGRTSDSSTPAGNFANPFGAVSCTGIGEEILDAALASSICARLEDGMKLSDSVERSIKAHSTCLFGIIALSAKGEAIVHATRGSVAFALVSSKSIHVGLIPEDWQKLF